MTATAASTRTPLDDIVAEHAIGGAALHVWLRGVLVAFVAAAVLWAPPEYYSAACRLLGLATCCGRSPRRSGSGWTPNIWSG